MAEWEPAETIPVNGDVAGTRLEGAAQTPLYIDCSLTNEKAESEDPAFKI